MITRLEADGFKSLSRFSIDLPPFVALVGTNASGKSNIFDALALLSRLVAMPLAEALAGGRGEPEEQFRRRGDGSRTGQICLAAELLVPRQVSDGYGSVAQIEHTRLRYEIAFSLRADDRGIRRPLIDHESITPIPRKRDRLKHVETDFATEHLVYAGSNWKILQTETRADGTRYFALKGARRSPQGHMFEIPAARAASSVLSSIGTAIDYPLLYAVRREIESWRFLQLEPAAVRLPSPVGSPDDHLDNDGKNLAWILELLRLSHEAQNSPGLNSLSGDLARIVKGFADVEVRSNAARGQWEVYLHTRDEGEVSARVASDGTLRMLALLAALYEPDEPGVVCFEEPENGINPQRLAVMIEVLRSLVTDMSGTGRGRESGLVQLIMSSHSPKLPLELEPEELLVVDTVGLVEERSTRPSRVTRARRILRKNQQSSTLDGWPGLPEESRFELPGISRSEAEQIVDAL